jgi:aspartyl-tRNA(Asn)/glutamyl-tRNA(Gln) amidotransferase subunit C
MENFKGNDINDYTVRYVAGLARLSLTEEEGRLFKEQLSGILGYIEKLGEVDTEGVLPTTHVLPSMKNVFREDVPAPSITSREALSNTPDRTEDLFKVPRIIKEK